MAFNCKKCYLVFPKIKWHITLSTKLSLNSVKFPLSYQRSLISINRVFVVRLFLFCYLNFLSTFMRNFIFGDILESTYDNISFNIYKILEKLVSLWNVCGWDYEQICTINILILKIKVMRCMNLNRYYSSQSRDKMDMGMQLLIRQTFLKILSLLFSNYLIKLNPRVKKLFFSKLPQDKKYRIINKIFFSILIFIINPYKLLGWAYISYWNYKSKYYEISLTVHSLIMKK